MSQLPLTSSTALRRVRDLPGPPAPPLVGHLLQLEVKSFHLQLERWAAQYGPLYQLRFGRRPGLVICDHELVQAVLRDRPAGFRRSPRMTDIIQEMGLPLGLFNAEGSDWEQQRRMVMAGLDPSHIKLYYPAMQRVAQRLVARWRRAAGAEIDLRADLMRYTVDIVAGLAFGYEVDTLGSGEDVIQRHMDQIMPTIFRRMFKRLPTWRWWPSAADRQLKEHVVALRASVQDLIHEGRERLAAEPELARAPTNLLEAMIVAANEPNSGMNDETLEGNVLTLLLAGEDTTANTIAWLLHLLWRDPAAMARARAEVQALGLTGEDAAPSYEQLGQLDFIEACAHEAMRLKPVAPMMTFEPLRPTEIGGVAVGTDVLLVLVMRHDSISDTHLPQADRFAPERWLSDSARTAKRVSMPFGAGARMCPGRYLALQEIKLAVATLLAHFDVAALGTSDGAEPEELLAFTMAPVGLSIKLHAH